MRRVSISLEIILFVCLSTMAWAQKDKQPSAPTAPWPGYSQATPEERREELDSLYEDIIVSQSYTMPDASLSYEERQAAFARMEKLRNELNEVVEKDFQLLLNELRRGNQSPLQDADAMGLNALNFPQLDSSTSALPLKQVLLCRLLDADYAWHNPQLHFGFWGLNDNATRFVQAKHLPGREGRVASMINSQLLGTSSGTNGAYSNLIGKYADLILVAREPSPDEIEMATQASVLFDVQPIARDAFVFITNFKNPVQRLTTEQIRLIYQNKITNWSEVGGPDAPINAYQRNRNSGSQELMEKIFMQGEELFRGGNEWETDLVTMSMMGPFNKLTKDTFGIGYSVYFYEHFMQANPFIVPVAVDDVLPTFETIKSGDYPYTTEVYAVIRKDADKETRALFEWLQTEEGQSVVVESGYVSIH